MDANEAMSKAMVEAQRFLEYGANVARTRRLRVVAPDQVVEETLDELASIEEEFERVGADLYLIELRFRRFATEVARLVA